jgi:hypothetical protein
MRKSGYDAAANVHWFFGNKGDRPGRCGCPACLASYRRLITAGFGRCRSGMRWFWLAYTYGTKEDSKVTGFAATEAEAVNAAMAAVLGFRNGDDIPIYASAFHGTASHELRSLNKAKRLAGPPSGATDSRIVEYLYGYWHGSEDVSLQRFRILRRTTKRIYYLRKGERIDGRGEPAGINSSYDNDRTGFVDRKKLEAEGHVHNYGRHWSSSDFHLYVSLDGLLASFRRHDKPADLAALKAAMVAAHPDKGGSHATFIAARRAYEAARQRARSQEENRPSAAG